MTHKAPTNADIMGRLADLEAGVAGLQAGQLELQETQEKQGRRLEQLESRWDWLTETLGRLLASSADVRERLTVLTQRVDARMDGLEENIGGLACSPRREKRDA